MELARQSATSGNKNTIRIVIADGQPIFRDGLRAGFSRVPMIEVVGEAGTLEELKRQTAATRPRIVVMGFPIAENATSEIKEISKRCKVILLTHNIEPASMRAGLIAGASAYILKDVPARDIIEVVKNVHEGFMMLSSSIEVSSKQKAATIKIKSATSNKYGISQRGCHLIALVTQGLSSKQISTKLGLSIRTIETQRFRIMKKMGVHNCAGMVRKAIEEGLIGAAAA